MASLTHPVSGHRISTDDASLEFWKAAGYRIVEEPKAPAKKAAAKKSSTNEK